MASHGHDKKKSTRTPRLSDKYKTTVKYEMLDICSFLFKSLVHSVVSLYAPNAQILAMHRDTKIL